MKDFLYDQPAARIIFGVGVSQRLGEEVQRLDARRPIFIATPGRRKYADEAARSLLNMTPALHAEAVMHLPIETVRAAREAAKRHDADCCIAIGGGSAIDLSKAVALDRGIPVLAVPTTYGGSEVTPFYGYTEGGVKKGVRDRKVLPKTVLYDPALTVSLPPSISGPSGMNAIAHCVEGLYAKNANPIMTLLAAEGIRALARSLPVVVREPANLDARSDALYGAWLAGVVLGTVGMAVHHNISHVLGGTFNLPHANVHTIVLPHAAAFNREATPEAMHTIAEALGAQDAAQGIYDLVVRIGAPTALKDIGMPYEGLDRAAKLVAENPYYNPRPVEYDSVRQLLENAYHGKSPSSTRGVSCAPR
ncbi:MAG: maleylacetate reductase [Acidobacteria bacterium]|nr:MAG: maleylacetate reductase [Acidobacteriota bacterium]